MPTINHYGFNDLNKMMSNCTETTYFECNTFFDGLQPLQFHKTSYTHALKNKLSPPMATTNINCASIHIYHPFQIPHTSSIMEWQICMAQKAIERLEVALVQWPNDSDCAMHISVGVNSRHSIFMFLCTDLWAAALQQCPNALFASFRYILYTP